MVLVGEFAHGSVATNELAGGDFHFELVGELDASLFFGLAAAVGHEDVGARVVGLEPVAVVGGSRPTP